MSSWLCHHHWRIDEVPHFHQQRHQYQDPRSAGILCENKEQESAGLVLARKENLDKIAMLCHWGSLVRNGSAMQWTHDARFKLFSQSMKYEDHLLKKPKRNMRFFWVFERKFGSILICRTGELTWRQSHPCTVEAAGPFSHSGWRNSQDLQN